METQSSYAGLSPYERLVRLAEHIRPGMTRDQVERIFPQSRGGVQGQVITIYNEFPDARVEVAFNTRGGSCSGENQVIHAPKIFMTINW